MAIEQTREKAQGSRLVLLVALLTLAVDASAAFGRVFQGSRPGLRLGLAAGIAVLLAAVLERRHILLAAVASAAGIAVAVGVLVFPHTLWFGLPTMATLRAAGRAWSLIGATASTEVAPARPLAPLFLAGLVAVWAASFSAHSLAVRARSPLLALLPPAALLAFPSILLNQGARPFYVVVFLLGALELLFGDSLRRVGQWGPVAVWQGRPRSRLVNAPTSRGARRLGLVCLGVALLIPGILPGYRAGGLVDVHHGAHPVRVTIDPIVDLRPQLLRQDAVPLFTVSSPVVTYWRFAALDTYNGRLWNASNLDASGGRNVQSGPLASVPGIDPSTNVRDVQQRFQFQNLAQEWLPAAFDPVQIDAEGATFRYDPKTSMLVDPDFTGPGLSYTVTSRIVVPTFQQLDGTTSMNSPAAAPYLRLPPIPPAIVDLAHRIADPHPMAYRKILAIQNYLRTFKYNDHVAAGHSVDYLLDFLTKTKAGYCEQFAGAMAVMLRSLGIPARVAVGFTAGQAGPIPHTYSVTTQNAHAWVEVLFPSFGWLPFEPTPTRANPAAASIDSPLELSSSSGSGASGPAESCQHAGPGGIIVGDPCERGTAPKGGRGSSQGGGGRTPGTVGEPRNQGSSPSTPVRRPVSWRLVVFEIALLLALLILLAIPAVKLVRRRWALTRARAPRDRVLAAYQVLSQRAADLGMGRTSAETLWEYRSRLRERIRGLDGEFDRLTGLAGRAVYSERDITPDQAEEAAATARRTIRLLSRAAPASRKVTGWFWIDRASLHRPN